MRIYTTILSVAVALAAFLGFITANAQPHPLDDGKMVQGVATCAGSTCHSRQTASGQTVRQNEILTWQDPSRSSGAHARAYQVLLTPQSQAIARLAGFGPAEQAPECLSCHAHNVPESRRGSTFSIAEGVTCEACHGGAEDWLQAHYTVGATHENNIALGLYPTEDVEKRANLCLDCHYGSSREDQFVTHRIMGAGHPRMSFELELFTALQQHHTVDTDYRARKSYTGSIKTWAVGQSLALNRAASLFADDELGTDGLFPELYFFDCHACHKNLSNDRESFARWQSNPGRPLGPGVPVFNDSNLIMLKATIREVLPAQASELDQIGARLHASTTLDRRSAADAAQQLAIYSSQLQNSFMSARFDTATSKAILNRILDDAISAQYTNYAAGEQAVIAVDVFLNAMVDDGNIEPLILEALQPKIDAAFDAVQSPNAYNPTQLRGALRDIAAETRRL